MDALNTKLSNLKTLKRYILNIFPDIYEQTISSMRQQSSIYSRYVGLSYRILKEFVIAESGFKEFERISEDPTVRLALPSEDFIVITHNTLERISSSLGEASLMFFASFYKRIHSKSNIKFDSELFGFSMLLWILRGKGNRVVEPRKARKIAFLFAVAPNILPYIYRWLHKKKLSLTNDITIKNPRLDMLMTLIDKSIEELNAEIRGTASSLLTFLEQKNVIARVNGSDKFIIAIGRGSLTDLFNAFSRYSYEIAEKKIMFLRKEILFDSIVKNEKLERFTTATINKMYSTYQEINWLFYNLPAPDMVI